MGEREGGFTWRACCTLEDGVCEPALDSTFLGHLLAPPRPDSQTSPSRHPTQFAWSTGGFLWWGAEKAHKTKSQEVSENALDNRVSPRHAAGVPANMPFSVSLGIVNNRKFVGQGLVHPRLCRASVSQGCSYVYVLFFPDVRRGKVP